MTLHPVTCCVCGICTGQTSVPHSHGYCVPCREAEWLAYLRPHPADLARVVRTWDARSGLAPAGGACCPPRGGC